MPAAWSRVSPAVLAAAIPTRGGTMIMATMAKKHLTIYTRSRHAPGAGRPAVKDAFTDAAHGTLGERSRQKRNERVREAVRARGLRTNTYRRKSRARAGSPLYGAVYVISPSGITVE